MAITYYEIKKSYIDKIIKSKDFIYFKSCIEEKFDIKDIRYYITTENIRIDNEGFKKTRNKCKYKI